MQLRLSALLFDIQYWQGKTISEIIWKYFRTNFIQITQNIIQSITLELNLSEQLFL